MQIDGENYFTPGQVASGLSSAGNKVNASVDETTLTVVGWIGFKADIMVFGYSVDGADPVLTSVPKIPESAVKKAGGKYAQRYSIDVDLSTLGKGSHTVEIIALVDVDDGTPMRFISFDLVIE